MNLSFFSEPAEVANRAFLYGDCVQVSFFVHQGKLIMAEECYFYLMASMRKMRMAIPLTYTLEYFQELFIRHISENEIGAAVIQFFVYRKKSVELVRGNTAYYFEIHKDASVLALQKAYEIDMIKEVGVNANLLSGLHVHAPENIYAAAYAADNDLDDVILLNPSKRIARCITGNLLLLNGDAIRVPKQTEGAFISPLLENFVTFLHREKIAVIEEAEMIAFETQKAEEVLIVSDTKGFIPVEKIRSKNFGSERFRSFVGAWIASFD